MWRKRMTVWLVLLLAGGGSLLGGEPVPEADSIVLGLTPVLSVSDRTDAAGRGGRIFMSTPSSGFGWYGAASRFIWISEWTNSGPI